MNISFEGNMISNTLPTGEASNQPAGSSIKRGRNGYQNKPSHNQNKRFRRETNGMDDSSASLDDLAESLRECTQRLDSSLLDFSSNSNASSLNASMTSLTGGRDMGLMLGGSFSGGLNFNSSISSNTAPLLAPPSESESLRLSRDSHSRGPPPLMSFSRVPRESSDRL